MLKYTVTPEFAIRVFPEIDQKCNAMKIKDILDNSTLPILEDIILTDDDERYQLFEGRKWVNGKFHRNIGIDKVTHGVGQEHAHVLGRHRNQLVVVNLDGTASHGTRGKLHSKDANALRAHGYTISKDNIVEWVEIGSWSNLILS